MAPGRAAVRSAPMAAEHPRSIRSFVTRSGRITQAQQRALVQLWPKYGIEFAPAPLDAQALYGRDAPRTLEIGFGNGENLAALARAHPERDYLGVEVHRPGVGRLLLALERRELGQVRGLSPEAGARAPRVGCCGSPPTGSRTRSRCSRRSRRRRGCAISRPAAASRPGPPSG